MCDFFFTNNRNNDFLSYCFVAPLWQGNELKQYSLRRNARVIFDQSELSRIRFPLILRIYNFFATASKCLENNRHSERWTTVMFQNPPVPTTTIKTLDVINSCLIRLRSSSPLFCHKSGIFWRKLACIAYENLASRCFILQMVKSGSNSVPVSTLRLY